jgi:hypothetical protein
MKKSDGVEKLMSVPQIATLLSKSVKTVDNYIIHDVWKLKSDFMVRVGNKWFLRESKWNNLLKAIELTTKEFNAKADAKKADAEVS